MLFGYVKHRWLKVLERPAELVVLTVTPLACFLGQGDGVWRLCRVDSGPSPTGPLMTSVWVFHLPAKRYHTCPDKPFTTTGECGNTARATGEGKLSEGRKPITFRIYLNALRKKNNFKSLGCGRRAGAFPGREKETGWKPLLSPAI